MIDAGNYVDKSIGNYRVVALIGSGGFGSVYRGEHQILKDRLVAIKILHNHLSSPQELNRFLQEAQILEHMQHPHILQIFDAGIDASLPYLVTEYASHGSLRDLLKRSANTPLPIEVSLSILSQVGGALYYAHQQHIVHRDLKPENILFNANDAALLADFGIASTLTTSSVKYSAVIGTPSYLAPEQFQGTLSQEGDQYALGCIAYELFTGHVPFTAPDFFAMGFKHLTDKPIDPTQLNPALPKHIEQAILKAIAKQRGDRHRDVRAFIVALHGSVNSDSWPFTHTVPNTGYAQTYPVADNRAFPASSSLSDASTFIRVNTTGNDPQHYPQRQQQTELASFMGRERQWVDTRPIPPTMQSAWSGVTSHSGQKHPSQRRGITLLIASLLVALTLLASLFFVFYPKIAPPTTVVGRTSTGTLARSTNTLAVTSPTVHSTHPINKPTSMPTSTIVPLTRTPPPKPTVTVTPPPKPTVTQTVTVTPTPPPVTFPVPFSGANSSGRGVTTQYTYSGTVSISISGDGQANSTAYSDAFYIYTDASGNPLPKPDVGTCWVLFINGQAASVLGLPNYNNTHNYTISIHMNQPGTINFGICDGQPSDNTGSLTITVQQL